MRGWRVRQLGFIVACAFALSCSASNVVQADAFAAWRDAEPSRGEAFARFEALLSAEGVADVVPNHDLWLVDQLRPDCSSEPFLAPPETEWRNIVPALRFIRDHVKPAVGEVRVMSGYRDEAFNACVRGAALSAHRSYQALDLVPVDDAIDREALISILCPIHATEGSRAHVGLGIYHARRFHIDARGYRGWGHDHHAATFPCASVR